jgi:hypothetical protein
VFAALEQTLQEQTAEEQQGGGCGMAHMSMSDAQPPGAGRRASVRGYEMETTSSCKLSKDAQAVLFNAAYSAPAAALERSAAAAAASPRQRPLPWPTLLRGHAASSSLTRRQSRRKLAGTSVARAVGPPEVCAVMCMSCVLSCACLPAHLQHTQGAAPCLPRSLDPFAPRCSIVCRSHTGARVTACVHVRHGKRATWR